MFDSYLKLEQVALILAENEDPERKANRALNVLGTTAIQEFAKYDLRRMLQNSNLPPKSVLRFEAHLAGIQFDSEDIGCLTTAITQAANEGEPEYAVKVLEGAFAHYEAEDRQYLYDQLQKRGAPESIMAIARSLMTDTRGSIVLGEADNSGQGTHQPSAPEKRNAGVTVRIGIVLGLHMRPSYVFARIADSYSGSVQLRKGVQSANGKSVLELLGLGASCDSEVTLILEAGKEGEQEIRDSLLAILGGTYIDPSNGLLVV